jgi:predicted amidohydrolase YtcJ
MDQDRSVTIRHIRSIRDSFCLNGWYPEQRITPEEAVRGYSTWAAYAAFWEKVTGVIAPGRWADITVSIL